MTGKPKTQNADLDTLPPALRPLCQQCRWVLWRWKKRVNKWTKPPFTPYGVNAESNNQRGWCRHAAVVAALRRTNGSDDGFDGIGFMLRGANLTAVDLDHCLDTEGRPDAWAQAWLDTANGAYVERTPSGEGLRIIGVDSGERLQRRWTIDGARPSAAIEIYRNCERYITITGAQIGDCAELQPIDIAEKIVAFYDADGTAWGAKDKAKGTTAKGKKKATGAKNGGGQSGFDFNKAGSSIDYDDVIRNGVPNGQRSELFQAVVWHLAAQGKTVKEIVALLEQYPNGIAKKYRGRLYTEVGRSYQKWQAERQPEPRPDTEEPEENKGWKEVDKHGNPRPTCTNTRRALRALGINCSYDVFHDKLLVESPIIKRRDNLDQTMQVLRTKVEKAYGFDPGSRHVHDAVVQLCLENEFDPVRNYLGALAWDGEPRLDRWILTYTGAEDTELNREFGRIALIAAVRRVRSPGTKFDPIIVLEGPMGTNKSKAIEVLAGIENFSDQSIFGARDREQQELLAGVWLYEIAELSNIRRTEVEHIKAFASRTHDRARPAYGRTRVDQPRRCVLFATTNNDRYLKEVDRRFWPVKTTEIDIEALKRDRDQLWAEAAQRESEDASILLRRELWGAAGVEQQAREEQDPRDDVLTETAGTIEQDQERVFSRDLFEIVLGIHKSKLLDRDSKRLAKCMRRLGWKGPEVIRFGNKRTSGYYREQLQNRS
jgi:hypothetical protein